jgi:hypothetical protein
MSGHYFCKKISVSSPVYTGPYIPIRIYHLVYTNGLDSCILAHSCRARFVYTPLPSSFRVHCPILEHTHTSFHPSTRNRPYSHNSASFSSFQAFTIHQWLRPPQVSTNFSLIRTILGCSCPIIAIRDLGFLFLLIWYLKTEIEWLLMLGLPWFKSYIPVLDWFRSICCFVYIICM